MAQTSQSHFGLPSMSSWAGPSQTVSQNQQPPQPSSAQPRQSTASPAPSLASGQAVCRLCGRRLAAGASQDPQGATCSTCSQTSSTQTPMGSSPQSSSAAPPSIEGRAPLSQPTSSTTTSNPVKTDSVAKSRDDEPPAGSCPGDGVCNGAGGKTCCNGCPAYNNKIYTAHRHADGSNGRARKVKPESAGQEGASLQEEDTAAVASSSTAGPQQPQQQQQHHQQQQQQAAPTAAAATSAVGNTSDAGGPKPPTEAFGGMACENCGTRTTPLWRRDGQGKVACNACGLYYKLHGHHRPVGMKRTTIKRRKRAPANSKEDGQQDNDSAEGSTTGPPAKKPRKKRKTANSESQSNTSAASENGLDALLSASGAAAGVQASTASEPSSLSPSAQSMSLPDLALVASRMARQEEGPRQQQQPLQNQSMARRTASPDTSRASPAAPAAATGHAAPTTATNTSHPPAGQHHHHPHLHHHHHHSHLHPSRAHLTHLPNPAALPTNVDELKTYRKTLAAQVSATHEHMKQLQLFAQRGEQVLAQIDETVAKAGPPDHKKEVAAEPAVAPPPASAGTSAIATKTAHDAPHEVASQQEPNASSTPPPANSSQQQHQQQPQTQDDFYARIVRLPVHAAVPLRKKSSVPVHSRPSEPGSGPLQ